jgi:hypothetical protein
MAARSRRRSRGGRKPPADPLARERALDALSRMRSEGLSRARAARLAQTTPETVLRYVGTALRRGRNGRYTAKPSDRLSRRMWMLTADGKVEVKIRSSRRASEIAEYMSAVDAYLSMGSADALAKFRDKSIRSGGITYAFATDPAVLDRLANAGEVSFERLYVLRA